VALIALAALATLAGIAWVKEHHETEAVVVTDDAAPVFVTPTVAAAPVATPSATPASAPSPSTGEETVRFGVKPWGQVFVDGTLRGVAPPLNTLRLPLGKHHFEVRNPQNGSNQVDVDLDQAGAERILRFDLTGAH
jgi:hypothetical protein